MKLVQFLFLSIILFFHTVTSAQSKDDDLDHLFDDGGMSTAKNVVKLNLATIIIGDVPFSYERIIGERIGIEVGVGKLMNYYNPDLAELSFGNDLEEENLQIKGPKGGYSFVIFPKYYYNNKAPLTMYSGLKYRKRNYTFNSKEDIILTDFSFNYGFQFTLIKKLVVDYNMGIGFRWRKDENTAVESEINNITLPLAVKIGYLF